MVENRIALKESAIVEKKIIDEVKYDENSQLAEIKSYKKLYLAMFNITFTSDCNDKDSIKDSLLNHNSDLSLEKNEIILTSFSGPIDDSNILKVSSLIHSSLSDNLKSIIFDLEKLTYINCRGLNAILSLANQPYLSSVKIYFIKTPENIFSLFKLVGFNKIFKFHMTLKDVLNELDFSPNSRHEITELSRYLNSYQCTNCNQIFSITAADNGICPNC